MLIRSKGKTIIVATPSDLHVGSTVALSPPEVQLDDGGTYLASKVQRYILQGWNDYWAEIDGQVKDHKAKLYVIVVGEACEGVHHGTTQIFSHNKAVQRVAALELLDPVAQKADKLWIVRGTEAHSGKSANEDEAIARDLGAIKNDILGTWSWWSLRLIASKVRLFLAHHPRTKGWMPHTEDSAASRMSFMMSSRWLSAERALPDLAVFGHVHYYADSGRAHKPRVIYLPGWQLATSFVHRLGSSYEYDLKPMGGIYFICKDGSYTIHEHLFIGEEDPWNE
jgi:hypothetical protein